MEQQQDVGKLVDFLKQNADGIDAVYTNHGAEMRICYVKSVVDEVKIHEKLIEPFLYTRSPRAYAFYLESAQSMAIPSPSKLLQAVCEGYAAVLFESRLYLVDVNKRPNAPITEAKIETVIQGPQNSFSENIETNMNMIRHRYTNPSLRFEVTSVGTRSRTMTLIMYDEEKVDFHLLDTIRRKLDGLNADLVQSAGQLAQMLTSQRRRLFPTIMVSERPDRVALNLTQGKIVVMIEGEPFALIAPAVLYDFMASTEDIYQYYWISRFLLCLRYLGLFISVSLPAIYVGVTAYNPELFRVQLALSIAGSRISVPYPAFIEVLFMLLMMELLTEASLRLPKHIGQTATTVGGLILGQAATQAGLVSDLMIIIVAAVAISNFVIPINSFSFAVRVIKYPFLVVATLYGLIGLMVGYIALIAYLCHLDSFGQPFLKIFKNDDEQIRGGIL